MVGYPSGPLGPQGLIMPLPRLPLSPAGSVGPSGPMGQCRPPVPSYRRGRRDQEDPPLRRQTSPPLPPNPWDPWARPLPWTPGSPWTCAATGTRVALGTLERNQVARGSGRSAGSRRPVLPVPAPSGSAYSSDAKRVLMSYTLMTLPIFPFLCKTFFTVLSGNAMTALTLNNLYHQPIK
ncbi:L-protein-like protein [Tiger frog virus]|uniref:L-protein-like protein n=1 Tax=Rana tigrina ranavirus TaxID=160691 RepID=Q2WEU2_RTRV|nr:hypothetical protein [Tiger frog virus]QKG82297.1 L-protein-like protein [Tiger frog virus]QKG82400.1 L-protein-like protein [Tiger frog virus]QKG82503.1 L-protein-like protein [Tiger frog virus]QKG82606.1 L-protein-like protein [Tiger frog virus]